LETDYPGSAESLFACGEILELFGQSDEAIWCWRKCLSVDPGDAEAHEQIGLVHFKRGEFDQAALRLDRASRLDPQLPDVRLHLGRALLHLGRYPEAIAVLQRQTELQPRAAEGWCRLGQAYQESGDQERARKSFVTAIDVFPDCTPAWLGAARAYEELGQLDKAREYRRRFQELDEALTASDRERRRADAYSADREKRWLASTCAIAARVYTMHDEIEAARDLWNRAIELDARNLSYRQALGQCLARRREFADEALAVFADLHRREPQNPDHLLAQAFLHQKLKQLDAAERELEQAMQVAPQDPRAAIRLARLYLSTGKELPKAQRLAERVVQIQPTAENFFLLSSLCRANSDAPGAKAALQEAIRLDPQNPQYAAAAQGLGQE
jgi:tetratricopeptide (TPR) repeat protein